MKKNIPIEIYANIDENLKALGQINYDDLTEKEIDEIKEEYESLIELAIKLKKKFKK